MEDQVEAVLGAAVAGWRFSAAGRIDEAIAAFAKADRLIPSGSLNPGLSVLRHNVGEAKGLVVSVAPSEDHVIAFCLPETAVEAPDSWRMTAALIDGAVLEKHIRLFIDGFDPRHHAKNIVRDLPHMLVLSTGRCGTVSLYHLFERSRLIPYHTYWWLLAPTTRWEMMCRFIAGNFTNEYPLSRLWCSTRAAEWLGAMASGRPMIGLNHLDTIFAPAFAALHRQSRFIHLRRDPCAVFRSFFGKGQWQESQLRPMFYSFNPDFRFRKTGHDLPACIAWYVHFTNVFAEAVGRVVGPDRFLTVSSDKLFGQDRDEVGRLLAFTEADIDIDDAVAHFTTRMNEKAHKVELTSDQMASAQGAFSESLARLEQTGRL